MIKRKKFTNPYLGLTKEDFAFQPGTYLEKAIRRIEKADEEGKSVAFARLDGDFFYDGVYYSADAIVPHKHWFRNSKEHNKKLWIAVIYNVPYGEKLDADFDINLVEDDQWGALKSVFVSELDEEQKKHEKQVRIQELEIAEQQDKEEQEMKNEVLQSVLSRVTVH